MFTQLIPTVRLGALLFLFKIILFLPAANAAQQTDTLNHRNKRLPDDKAVKTGKLANGFRYFIRKNATPEKRAVLYLVNKVGSLNEHDNQQGLAHFMEHMAFKGTKNFPKNELINYLQKAGVKFGADLNAYTSYAETVYQLPIPSDDPQLLFTGIQILRDWAQDVQIEKMQLESERGVILEEKRQRKGLQQRIQEQTLPILLNNSRYVQRQPIGKEEVLKNFDPELLRQFYRDWYRPDLQAIIAVGDFNVQEMETLIKQKFGDLKNPAGAPAAQKYAVKLVNGKQFKVVTDPEISDLSIQIFNKYESSAKHTEQSLMKGLSLGFFKGMLSARLNDLARNPNAPFLKATASVDNIASGIGAATVSITVKPGETERGFKAAMLELEQVRQFGFTQAEFERTRAAFIASQAYQFQEKDKIASEVFVSKYLQAFLNDAPFPSTEFYFDFYQKHIDSLKVSDVNAWINRFYDTQKQDIFVLAPDKKGLKLPDQAVLTEWLSDVAATKLNAYKDTLAAGNLIKMLPQKGHIIKEESLPAIGTTLLTLSNGAKVILKPTDFKHNEILMSAFSPGGSSLYGEKDYQSAINAAGVIGQSGLGDFDAKSMPKKLVGKMVAVTPYISDYFEGLNAQSSATDLETCLQLIHLYFTKPRLDEVLVEGMLKTAKATVLNRYKKPANVFSDTVSAIVNGYHWRRSAVSVAKIDQINPKRSMEIYKERFADAADFTFIFTGSFVIDSIKPLIEQYLGSLPALKRKENWTDLGINYPAGAIEKTVYQGTEEKATVLLGLSGPYKPNKERNLYGSALQEILKYRLTDRLRAKESGVYTPSVSISMSRIPTPRFAVNISFTCDPARVDQLIAATKEELARLSAEGPTAEELTKFKAEFSRSMELSLNSNEYWLNLLNTSFQLAEDPQKNMGWKKDLSAVNQKAFKKQNHTLLDLKRLMKFVLLPEKEKK
ncbi:insulinase family protein [Pedobacter sp. MC2016-14]|uniref:M16 family metallopeptidase n=1 Tax=Pedobacter sp. MC2016-14 TaxID=2897327 RepID=UPI001E2C9B4D|nr:insulinase family protein [Pedobacter sp. MC2016-14]MCD0489202.1 insulinase family protein [Pedobacter sp. MC2016-14]